MAPRWSVWVMLWARDEVAGRWCMEWREHKQYDNEADAQIDLHFLVEVDGYEDGVALRVWDKPWR